MNKILFILLMIFLISCSNNDLTKEDSFELLNSNYPKYFGDYVIGDICPGKMMEIAKYLESKGYWNINGFKNDRNCYGFNLTEKGRLYVSESYEYNIHVYLTVLHFDKVQGVSMIDKNKAEVLFTEISIPTKFSLLTPFHKNIGTIWERKALFTKYDTGWKLDEIVAGNISNDEIKLSDALRRLDISE